MSQRDRQLARARAVDARDRLRTLIRFAGYHEGQRVEMCEALDLLWLEADLAMGGAECRP
jgi:hypothetical protein